jgi:hypothetical protein
LQWCDVYIPVLSRAALDSPWCCEEINAAIDLSNRRGRNHRPRIISILIESLGDDMPALLAARLYFSFVGNYEAAFRDLLGKGFGLVPASPTRVTAAAAPVSPRRSPAPGHDSNSGRRVLDGR